MLHRLATVRMGDDLGLRNTIGVVGRLSRCRAGGRGISRGLPLRDTRGKLHEVVLLARTIPLSNPTSREMGRGIRGAFSAR